VLYLLLENPPCKCRGGFSFFCSYAIVAAGGPMTPYLLFFSLGFLIRSLFSKLLNAYDYVKTMKEIEIKFLLLASNYLQWRVQALEVLKLSYKYVEQERPEEKEMNDRFLSKVEEKYDSIINQYIKELKERLPYSTPYNNLEEIQKYINKNVEK
jgi:hypothetical protein